MGNSTVNGTPQDPTSRRSPAGEKVILDEVGGSSGIPASLGDLTDVDPAVTPAKGSVLVGDGSVYQELAVGADDLVPIADAAETLGVRWGAVTMQSTYDRSGAAQPKVTVTAANGPVTFRDNATPIGTIFAVQNNAGDDVLSASATDVNVSFAGAQVFDVSAAQIDVGIVGNRTIRIDVDPAGKGGINYMPDGRTITSTVTQAAMQWDSTVTTDIPGGGGLGNDNVPAAISWTGTCIFADQGFLFASGLLVNAATQVQCQANIGPLYLFLDQYRTFADGGSFSCSQHNSLRLQPSWGPNINGGSIIQTSAVYTLNSCTVDASVGSASITDLIYWQANSPTLVSGGTIGTFTAIDIANISGPTTIRGINSAMSSGTFINHTGTAVSTFTAANVQFNDGVGVVLGTGSDVLLNWNGTAFEWDPAVGDDLRIAFATNVHTVTTSSASVLAQILFGHPKAAFGQITTIGNQKFVFAANAETWSGGGTSIDQVLLTQAGNDTVNTTNVSRFSGWAINAPNITIDAVNRVTTITGLTIAGSMSVSGATVTNKAGLHVTSNPTGGTGINAAIWVTAGNTQLDGTLTHAGTNLGLYGATPVVQPSGTGETVGFTAGAGTGVNDDSTFTGNVGATAYRISDVVKALKNTGLLAA